VTQVTQEMIVEYATSTSLERQGQRMWNRRRKSGWCRIAYLRTK